MPVKHYPVNDTDLDKLADKLLELDASNQWTPYTQYDLSNALLVLIRVGGSMIFKRYLDGQITLDQAGEIVEKLGRGMRLLTIETIGIDPHETMKDLKALNEEQKR